MQFKTAKKITIECPIEIVFEHVADPAKSQAYLGQSFYFERVDPPPVQVGTKARLIGRFANFSIRLNYIITEYQPPTILRFQALSQVINTIKVDSEVLWRLEPQNNKQTQVNFQLTMQPSQKLNNFAALLFEPLLHAAEAATSSMLDKAMLRLKEQLEINSR